MSSEIKLCRLAPPFCFKGSLGNVKMKWRPKFLVRHAAKVCGQEYTRRLRARARQRQRERERERRKIY